MFKNSVFGLIALDFGALYMDEIAQILAYLIIGGYHAYKWYKRHQAEQNKKKLKKQEMARLDYLMIHCTATPKGRNISSDWIRKIHLKHNGWRQVGYRDMIHLDGSLENLVNWDQDEQVESWEVTNGARGMNSKTAHVVYVGGVGVDAKTPEDTRTHEQYDCLRDYVWFYIRRYPNIKVIGHNEVANKSCPSFDVGEFCREIGIPRKNIGL